MPLNFEFKARSNRNGAMEEKLLSLQSRFAGTDHQTDTYFNVQHGRLKLREGTIENALIYYNRPDVAEAKTSAVLLYRHQPEKTLKDILTASLGIKAVVKKERRIWFVGNVKIHFDRVDELGEFVEVEAISNDEDIPVKVLQEQCNRFADILAIKEEDFIAKSYSDLILKSQVGEDPAIDSPIF